jgi:hypothetical protein
MLGPFHEAHCIGAKVLEEARLAQSGSGLEPIKIKVIQV